MPQDMLDEDELALLTPGEQRFEELRKRAGVVLAPLVFLGVFFAPLAGLTKTLPSSEVVHNVEAHRLAAIMATTAVLWVCETLPLTVTALAAAVACIILRVDTHEAVFAPFASFIMFLFIGSFMLARAVFIHGLDRRFAYGILALPWIGARPSRILLGFGIVTTFMSGWISNTATTAMMFAIGMSILAVFFREEEAGHKIDRRFATGLMLMTSFGASIGGLATPIGTPPNLIGIKAIQSELGVKLSFFQWSLIGFPIVLAMFVILYFYLNFFCPAGVKEIRGGAELLQARRRELGPWTTSQKSTMLAFGLTVALWIFPGLVALAYGQTSPTYNYVKEMLNEGAVAVLGAVLLFILPGDRGGRAINWREASQIDWGIVLLYGGGFALGQLADETGLAAALGKALQGVLQLESGFAMLVFGTIVAVAVSEATSNTASAIIIVPIVISTAKAAGIDPLVPALGATFGASLGFMLPVSTPCNAIVYGSGYIPITRMIRYGVLLDIAGIVVVVTILQLLVPHLF